MNLPSGDAARWCGPSSSTGTSPTGTSPRRVPAMGSTYDSVSDLPEAARAFADGDVALLPAALADADGAALVALLVERGDAARLQRLGESPDKALAKRARKALHLLKTRGVNLPAAPKREYRPQGPYVAEESSLASMIDGRGER